MSWRSRIQLSLTLINNNMETRTATAKTRFVSPIEKRWLVIYTRARWEKSIYEVMCQQGIECYCPLRTVYSQWADRKKKVELPVFSSYLFVRVNQAQQGKVLNIAGVLNYINYMGRPAVVRDRVIEDLKLYLENYKDAEMVNLANFSIGDQIRIKSGVMEDTSGTVIRIDGKYVLMLVDSIDCVLVTKVPIYNIDLKNHTAL